MCEYFPERKPLKEGVKVQLELSNYASKGDLKNETVVNALSLLKRFIYQA